MRISSIFALCLLIFPHSNAVGQSFQDTATYKSNFARQIMKNLAFIKRKSDRMIVHYSVEGGSINEYVIEYLPAAKKLTLYTIEAMPGQKVKSVKSAKKISNDSLKNSFGQIWQHVDITTLEDISHYCKKTWRSSAMAIVEVSKGKEINYFTANETDTNSCQSEKIQIHKRLLALASEIAFDK